MRACKVNNETQEHLLSECETLHQDDTTKVHLWDFRTDSTSTLKVVSKKWKHPRKTPSMIKVKSKNLVRKNTVTHSPVRAGRNENELVIASKSL